MSVEDFHKSRRMFCIRVGKILTAAQYSTMSHIEWFESIGLDGKKTLAECVRGFADDRGIFFYRGEDFEVEKKDEDIFFKYLGELQTKLKLPHQTQVYGGVKKTKDLRYPPKKKYGTIADNK